MRYEFVDEDEKTICFGSYCDCGYGAQPGLFVKAFARRNVEKNR